MKFLYLDGLRGLAALIVVIDHLAICFFQAATDGSITSYHARVFEKLLFATPLHLLVSGNFSVCIFFALSGFVLSTKFFRTHDRGVAAASAWKRYLRLELPILGSVMLSYVLISLHWLANVRAAGITRSAWQRYLWNVHPDLLGAIYHAAVGVFIAGSSPYNTVLWTMRIELLGSFLVFAFLFFSGRWRYRWVAYAGLTLAFINSYLLCFVAGMAICDWYFSPGRKTLRSRFWLPVLLVGLLLGSSPVGTLRGTIFAAIPSWLGYGMPLPSRLHVIGSILLVFALVFAPALQRPLQARPLLWLGRVSFALYLTHLLVIGSFTSWLFSVIEPYTGYLAAFGLSLVPSALLIGLVAHWFTRLVDEPAIRLSAEFYRRWFPARWRTAQDAPEPRLQTAP